MVKSLFKEFVNSYSYNYTHVTAEKMLTEQRHMFICKAFNDTVSVVYNMHG